MQTVILFSRVNRVKRTFHLTAFISALVLFLQPTLGFVTAAHSSKSPGKKKSAIMSEDQRIAHVLSRFTFGARPGDFEKVKAMGVEAFIAEQLDPDSIENSTAIAKLKRLPTLGMATPVIIEQYTPPKPVVSPPSPAQPAEKLKAAAQIAPAQMPAQKNLPDNIPGLMASESAKSVSDVMQKPGENTQTTNLAPPEIQKETVNRTAGPATAKPSPPPN